MRLVDERQEPIVLDPGELLILRQWRWDAAKLQEKALIDFDNAEAEEGAAPPYYGVSVFAMPREGEEDIPELVDRLLTHILAIPRGAAHFALVTEKELEAAGFTLDKDEPPPHHYNIPVGVSRDDLRVEELATVFGLDDKIRMPK